MATFNKYVRLNPDVLLEWIYDDSNLQTENYQVVNNLTNQRKGFVSTLAAQFNQLPNTIFEIDAVLKKYSKVDPSKYSYLKLQNFNTPPVTYDKLRLHLPTSFTFNRDNVVGASSYKGFYLHVYTYDNNNKIVDLAQLVYDDEDPTYDRYLNLNIQSLTYDNKFWGKYVELTIPSVNTIAKQLTNTFTPTPDSINQNLTTNVGLSRISPIFVQFAFLTASETVFGIKYYYLSDVYSVSISQVPEYQTLGVQINESAQGDYFEIAGTYNGTNQQLDDFMQELVAAGKQPQLEYTVYLYEENILSATQTYVVTENYSKILTYRPVIQFSNTTAAIDVEMAIVDLVDESRMVRTASINLTTNIFKYGRYLTRINMDNAFKPKIYNRKQQSFSSSDLNLPANPLTIQKVNYPILVDRVKILVGSSLAQNTDYKKMGLLEIILTPFTNVLKFTIAAEIGADGSVTPYNLGNTLQNSTLSLSFRSDNLTVEKDIYLETDQNNFTQGIVIFKLDEADMYVIKSIALKNHDFFLTLNAKSTNTRSLLYAGKFALFNEVRFVDSTTNQNTSANQDGTNMGQDGVINEPTVLTSGSAYNALKNQNVIIFLDLTVDVGTFEAYLSLQKANIFLKEAGGNTTGGAYVYLLLNVSPSFVADLKIQTGVRRVIPLDFNIGQNLPTTGLNLDNIKNQVAQFNCSAAQTAQKNK